MISKIRHMFNSLTTVSATIEFQKCSNFSKKVSNCTPAYKLPKYLEGIPEPEFKTKKSGQIH